MSNCLNCLLNPWVGCRNCNWKMCKACRRSTHILTNRALHRQASPQCTEALDVETNYIDWPKFFADKL